MDPTATLDTIHDLVHDIMRHDDTTDSDAIALCGMVECLSDWLSRGGALPIQWQPKPLDCHRCGGPSLAGHYC